MGRSARTKRWVAYRLHLCLEELFKTYFRSRNPSRGHGVRPLPRFNHHIKDIIHIKDTCICPLQEYTYIQRGRIGREVALPRKDCSFLIFQVCKVSFVIRLTNVSGAYLPKHKRVTPSCTRNSFCGSKDTNLWGRHQHSPKLLFPPPHSSKILVEALPNAHKSLFMAILQGLFVFT